MLAVLSKFWYGTLYLGTRENIWLYLYLGLLNLNQLESLKNPSEVSVAVRYREAQQSCARECDVQLREGHWIVQLREEEQQTPLWC